MSDEQYQDIKNELKEMRAEMKPVIDVFNTIKMLGKWSAVVVGFMATATAALLGIKELFKK